MEDYKARVAGFSGGRPKSAPAAGRGAAVDLDLPTQLDADKRGELDRGKYAAVEEQQVAAGRPEEPAARRTAVGRLQMAELALEERARNASPTAPVVRPARYRPPRRSSSALSTLVS